jgi:integrase
MGTRGRQLLNRLTDREAKTLPSGVHSDGGGLRLKVSKTGVRTWVFRFQINGRTRDVFLGNLTSVGLAEAREKAAEYRRQAKAKTDPLEARQLARAALKAAKAKAAGGLTFEKASEALVEQRGSSWSASNIKAWRQSVRDYCGSIANLPCEQVEANHIYAIFDPIWFERHDLAKRLRFKVERILSYARSSDAKGQYFEPNWVNPARWKDHLVNRYGRHNRGEIEGYKYLSPAQVQPFIAALREEETTARLALEFIALTTCRISEGLNAQWIEFDLAEHVWRIPKERMKAKHSHVVPLTPRAVEIIEEMGRRYGDEGIVFRGRSGKKPLCGKTLRDIMHINIGVEASPHGLRKTFKTWATEAGIRDDVSEGCLAHKDTNTIRRAYQKSDLLTERRKCLEAWTGFLDSKPQSNVLPLFG